MGFCDKEKRPVKPHKQRPKRTSKADSDRFRKRFSVVTDTFVKTHYLTTPIVMPEPWEQTRYRSYESIHDTSGFLQNWHNPVTHVKYKERFLKRPGIGYDALCRPATSTVELPNVFGLVTGNLPSPDPETLEQLSAKAMSHFLNAVEPRVLFLNFLIELLEAVHGAVEKAGEALEKLEEIIKNYRKLYLEYLKKGLSNADSSFLAYMFAVKPFIGDMQKLFCILQEAEKRTAWLLKNQDKPVRILFRKEECWKPDDDFVIGPLSASYAFGPWDPAHPPWEAGGVSPIAEDINGAYSIKPVYWKLDFFAQATVVYHLPPCRFTSDGSGIGLVLSSMLATDRLGSAIWEAIPFSFVVDWFTDVGTQLAHWIDGATKNFPDGKIIEVGHSFKLMSAWDVYWTNYCDSEAEHLGKVTYKKYQRSTGLPGDLTYFFANPLDSGMHIALSSALVSQRYKSIKKRRKPRLKIG